MKSRISEEPQKPVKRVYTEVLAEALAEINSGEDNVDYMTSKMPAFTSVNTIMYRERRKNMPALPTTRSTIELPEDAKKMPDGRIFLQSDDGDDDKLLLFATDNSLTRLFSAHDVFVDGTFYTCPRLFCQLFTLHVEAYGKVLPMAFSLLPDKSQHTYQRLFRILKTRAQNLGLQFSPTVIRSDYEQGIISAVRQEFPNSRMNGCLFHYGQALWRKVQALGGGPVYRENPDVRQYIRRCAALAFVPLDKLDDAWIDLQAAAEDHPLCTAFADYFVTTYMDDVTSRFPRVMWNHFENMSQNSIRTNNALESWHKNLKTVVGSAHPNLFKIIFSLQKEQSRVEDDLQMLRAGQQTGRTKRVAIRRRNQRLEEIKNDYLAGAKTLMQLLDHCSYAIHF